MVVVGVLSNGEIRLALTTLSLQCLRIKTLQVEQIFSPLLDLATSLWRQQQQTIKAEQDLQVERLLPKAELTLVCIDAG